jgi:hypothetical protein
MDCIIRYHTDIPTENIGAAIGSLFAITAVRTVSGTELESELFHIELRPYEDGMNFGEYIPFPDFFLFNHVLNYQHKIADDVNTQIEIIAKILNFLWGKWIPAAAECSYDAYLPHDGGYLSKDVPWPNEIIDEG